MTDQWRTTRAEAQELSSNGGYAPAVNTSRLQLIGDGTDATDWQLTCRYCGRVGTSPQGRSAHETRCNARPTEPPAGPGPFDVRVTAVEEGRYTWEAFTDGVLVANALGRTWTVAVDCEDNAASFLGGAWGGPTRKSQQVRPGEARRTAVKREQRERRAAGTARKPGRPRKATTPAVREPAPVRTTDPETSKLLAVLDDLTDGGTWPADALPDVGEWLAITSRLMRLAVHK